jgi:hypothetical protein
MHAIVMGGEGVGCRRDPPTLVGFEPDERKVGAPETVLVFLKGGGAIVVRFP